MDRSHRKLAHRGSYLGRFWCSPSTVRLVLLLGDKHFRPRPQPDRSAKSPFPGWAGLVPNSIWIYDSTHFTRCGMTVLIFEDLISRSDSPTLVIAQHFGRPSTPTDQAWIESLNGTIKTEWPHLLAITDPQVLRAELDTIQTHYNSGRRCVR